MNIVNLFIIIHDGVSCICFQFGIKIIDVYNFLEIMFTHSFGQNTNI